jgi:salicylate synthetase
MLDNLEHKALSIVRALADDGSDFFIYSRGAQIRVGIGCRARYTLRGDVLTVRTDDGSTEERIVDPFTSVAKALANTDHTAFGYLAFDLAHFRFDYPRSIDTPLELVVAETEIVLEHDRVSVEPEARRADVEASLDAPFSPSRASPLLIDPTANRDLYRARLEAGLDAVRRGDLEKVILSRTQTRPGSIDVLATYERALSTPGARRYCFRFGSIAGVGVSPEVLLVSDADRTFLTNPLAGTKPRGKSKEEDEALIRELFHEAKEVREHAMSVRRAQAEVVDLCAPGTFRIFDFMAVKSFRFTIHLSSRVGGRLRVDKTAWDAMRSVFPGVTVTGVEKEPAIALIGALETEPRGIYGGAVGVVERGGALDFGLAIRAAFERDGRVHVSAGAGIVAESRIEAEIEESENKMRTILHALCGES